ncbi:MAG: hypothetical protein Q8K58_16850 [Acidimicrobiales bacterium]|nr:hypothetical protein [Acidimicrobiales bacterium]
MRDRQPDLTHRQVAVLASGGTTSTTPVPAVEGWFTTAAERRLLGTWCTTCRMPRAASQ